MEDALGPYGLAIPSSAANYHDVVIGESSSLPPLARHRESNDDARYVGRLAYFTNARRPIDDDVGPPRYGVTIAIVGVHGSGRDARSTLLRLVDAATTREDDDGDDAHDVDGTTMTATTKTTTNANGGGAERILVVAPWFLAPVDICPPPPESSSSSSTSSSSSPSYLRWVDDACGPLGIEHSFRYGAESIHDVANNDDDTAARSTNTISSYAAMDVLIETLCDRAHYPDLERIVVVGHSAGGQLVHRWGLTSGSWCFGDHENDDDDGKLPSVFIVSANPRSYTYLDGRRYLPATSAADDENAMSSTDNVGGRRAEPVPSPPMFDDLVFRFPMEYEEEECRCYNRYMWGLEDNPDLPAPYIARNVDKLMARDRGGNGNHNSDALFCRYALRNVTYLSGENDTKMLDDQISNGDGYQGPTRRERCERYYAALQVRGNEILRDRRQGEMTDEEDGRGRNNYACIRSKIRFHSTQTEGREMRVHRLIIVKNVGHNGTLMFQSEEGRIAMFS